MFEIQWICLTVDYHLVKVYVVWLWRTFCSNIILTALACTKWLHLAEWSHMGVAFSICLAFPTLSFTFPFLLSHTLTVIPFSLFIHPPHPNLLQLPLLIDPKSSSILTHPQHNQNPIAEDSDTSIGESDIYLEHTTPFRNTAKFPSLTPPYVLTWVKHWVTSQSNAERVEVYINYTITCIIMCFYSGATGWLCMGAAPCINGTYWQLSVVGPDLTA